MKNEGLGDQKLIDSDKQVSVRLLRVPFATAKPYWPSTMDDDEYQYVPCDGVGKILFFPFGYSALSVLDSEMIT